MPLRRPAADLRGGAGPRRSGVRSVSRRDFFSKFLLRPTRFLVTYFYLSRRYVDSFELRLESGPCPSIDRVAAVFEAVAANHPSLDRMVCEEGAGCPGACAGLGPIVGGVPTAVKKNLKAGRSIAYRFDDYGFNLFILL